MFPSKEKPQFHLNRLSEAKRYNICQIERELEKKIKCIEFSFIINHLLTPGVYALMHQYEQSNNVILSNISIFLHLWIKIVKEKCCLCLFTLYLSKDDYFFHHSVVGSILLGKRLIQYTVVCWVTNGSTLADTYEKAFPLKEKHCIAFLQFSSHVCQSSTTPRGVCFYFLETMKYLEQFPQRPKNIQRTPGIKNQ